MKKIEQKVINVIKENKLIEANDRVLVALSGGPDSVFLLHFLNKFNRKFKITTGALHINHMLRGKHSSADEDFCRTFCRTYKIVFYSVKRNVRSFARKNKISIEEAGRELRYKELEKFRKKFGYNKIATAHTCSDNTETVFINLIKGTGLKGISGIPVKRNNIIRPLISLTKDEVLLYLKYKKLHYRTDITNAASEFERNYLRNEILPLIKNKLNISLDETIFNSSVIFKNYLSWIESLLEEKINKGAEFKNGILILDTKILNEIYPQLVGDYFRIVLQRNFSRQITFNDFKSLKSLLLKQAGTKVLLSGDLKGFRDRESILIYKSKIDFNLKPVELKENCLYKINEKSISFRRINKNEVNFNKDSSVEYVSADRIKKFLLRTWKPGDKFYPLGLKGSKNISDYLAEKKLSSFVKNKQTVLISDGKIVWVVGFRIDDRFKVTPETREVFELCLK
jgi:tRNA(Ile)-lysidine synthase